MLKKSYIIDKGEEIVYVKKRRPTRYPFQENV